MSSAKKRNKWLEAARDDKELAQAIRSATERAAKFVRTIERAHKNAAKSKLRFP